MPTPKLRDKIHGCIRKNVIIIIEPKHSRFIGLNQNIVKEQRPL